MADDDHIIIGVIAPLARNLPVAEGATLAADEINAAGGIDVGGRRQRIRLLVGDTESRPETAVSKALELISRDRAVALVGLPRSHSAIPVARLAEQQRVPLISTMSTHPETTAGKRYVFRLAFLNALQGRVLADFAFHDLGARRAAILVDAAGAYSSDLAKVFERVFQEHGGQVVAHEVFTEDDLVVARQLRTIKDSDADILFMPQHAEIVTLHGREARRLGIAATLLGSDTWSGIDSRDHPAFNDSYFSDFWAPDSADEKARGFITAYRRAFDADPLASAALSYDAVSLIAEAIRVRGGADSESITAGIASLGSFHGVSGTIDFRGSGDPVRSVFIRKVGGDGQIRLFKEVSP
ncbi:MAG: ABC transporter substrate-binding protein [bacterium]|nr:ABC transporter substrate-binding protein [bacterium]